MSYILIIGGIIIIFIFLYYSIRVINRDTYELETKETEDISNEFIDNINKINTDLIKKYINDMKLETRINEMESNIKSLQSSVEEEKLQSASEPVKIEPSSFPDEELKSAEIIEDKIIEKQ
ncbi:unknown similar to AMEV168 [Adoxophyes honmai entomopoxvirus 'L']|uniref:Uncharacterized protein n=1 Tax=Adoxophyes honmai entomopoxvirus 'L' TaxID=1293540 RepID=A0A916P0M3_9POXV|nr:unknown similar to AMEV168 [Adoxophyes honmai entomopoxvirus 'L']CCU55486.1 unknown similar to AMEV168 [Adoxophyes honmai entomopoxvirus 'L']